MLEHWLVSLITSWRQRLQCLSESRIALLRSWERFDVPCQVEVWHMTHKRARFHYQLLAFSHLVSLPDLQVVVHKSFSPRKASAVFNRVLRESYLWSSEQERAILENRIVLFFREFKDYLSNLVGREAPCIINRVPVSDKVFLWFVKGNIEEVDTNKVLHDIFEVARRRESKPDTGQLIEGFGAYFYPPVWIGKKPNHTVSRLRNRLYDTVPLRDPMVDTPIMALRWHITDILIFSDGFIFVGDKNEERCLSVLNWIMATAALEGIDCLAIKHADLMSAAYVGDEQPYLLKAYTTLPLSPRAMYPEPPPHLAPVLELERVTITHSVISEIVESANYFSNSFPDQSPVMVLKARSYFRYGDYLQSFITAWWIIESSLYSKLENILASREHALHKRRKEKLLKSGRWTVDDVLEVLEILKALDQSEYRQLQDLKRWRNKLIHGGPIRSIDEARRYAQSCMEWSERFVERAIGRKSCSQGGMSQPT